MRIYVTLRHMSPDRMLRPTLPCCMVRLASGRGIVRHPSGVGNAGVCCVAVVFVMLMAGEIWLAAPAFESARTRERHAGGRVDRAVAARRLFHLCAGTGRFSWWRAGIAPAFTLAPVALAASANGHKPGAWQDYAAMLVLALPIKLGWLRVIFPFPGGQLVYVLTVLMAVNTALAAFLFVRGLDGIGYSVGWARGWGWAFGIALAAIAAIDIPLGIGSASFNLSRAMAIGDSCRSNLLGIFLLTAVPEELLFRGLLQNFLGKSLSQEIAGWILASIIFGLSHIANGRFPNWRYVLLATIAGFFYGYAWRKNTLDFPWGAGAYGGGWVVVHAVSDVVDGGPERIRGKSLSRIQCRLGCVEVLRPSWSDGLRMTPGCLGGDQSCRYEFHRA